MSEHQEPSRGIHRAASGAGRDAERPAIAFTGHRTDKRYVKGPDRWAQERFDRVLAELVASVSETMILDVGCGEGWALDKLARALPDRRFVGVDGADDKLRSHWGQPHSDRIRYVEGLAQQLPFEAGEFGLITATQVLEHLPDPHRALMEMRRVAPGGRLIATVPFELMWRPGNILRGRNLRRGGNTPDHLQHWWTRASFRRYLGRHGTVETTRISPPYTLAVVHLAPLPDHGRLGGEKGSPPVPGLGRGGHPSNPGAT
ncbi:MAG: class I SAM-dependent methyltransferase [Solirubrobacteraceae bacterium]